MQGWHASGCRFDSWSAQKFFLVENLSLYSKELELGQDVLRYTGIVILIELWLNQEKNNLSSNSCA